MIHVVSHVLCRLLSVVYCPLDVGSCNLYGVCCIGGSCMHDVVCWMFDVGLCSIYVLG